MSIAVSAHIHSRRLMIPIAAVLLISMALPGMAQNQTLNLGICGGTGGDTVQIEATLLPTAPVGAFQFDFFYDPSVLTLNEVTAGPTAVAANKTVSSTPLHEGFQRIIIAGINSNVLAGGVAAILRFTIARGAPQGRHVLALVDFIATSPDNQRYQQTTLVDGAVDVLGAPLLEFVSPEAGRPRTLLLLGGSNLGACRRVSTVIFSGAGNYRKQVTPLEATARQVTVEVPEDATGTLNVALQVGSQISNVRSFRIDSSIPFSTFPAQMQDSIPLPTSDDPADVWVNQRTNLAFVCYRGGREVQAVDLNSGSTFIMAVVGAFVRMTGNPLTGEVLLLNAAQNELLVLIVIQLGNNIFPDLRIIKVGRNPQGLGLQPLTNRAVVANRDDNSASIVDIGNRSVIATVSLSPQPFLVAVDSLRNRAYVASSGGIITPLNLDGNSLGSTFSGISGTLRAMEIYEDGNLMLMGGSAGLLVRKLETGQQVQLLTTQDITAIVVHQSRGLAMIVSNAGRTITQVDLTTVMQDQGRAVIGNTALPSIEVSGLDINPFRNLAVMVHRGAGSSSTAVRAMPHEMWMEQQGAAGISRVRIPSQLRIPRTLQRAGEMLGLTISNSTEEGVAVQFTAISQQGQLLQSSDLLNPRSLTLPMLGQLSQLDSQIFGPGVNAGGNFWLSAASPNPSLKSIFLNGDFSSSMVGTEESGAVSSDAVLPAVRPGETNLISIVNPSFTATQANLTLVDNSGQVRDTRQRAIPAFGAMLDAVEGIFPGVGQLPDGGYVRVRSITGVRSYQQFVPIGRIDPAGLNAQSIAGGSPELVFAQFVTGAGFETRVGLVELTGQAQTVTLTLRNDQGNFNGLAPPITRSLPANGRLELSLGPAFGLPAAELKQGWLRVLGTGRLTGYLTYATSQLLAAVVSLPAPRTQLTFSHVAEEGTGFFTGLAIANTNSQAASVTIEVYNGAGAQVAASPVALSIPPNGRIVGLLHQLLGATGKLVIGQSGGYVQIKASIPVHGIEIFGADGDRAYANVPAQ